MWLNSSLSTDVKLFDCGLCFIVVYFGLFGKIQDIGYQLLCLCMKGDTIKLIANLWGIISTPKSETKVARPTFFCHLRDCLRCEHFVAGLIYYYFIFLGRATNKEHSKSGI